MRRERLDALSAGPGPLPQFPLRLGAASCSTRGPTSDTPFSADIHLFLAKGSAGRWRPWRCCDPQRDHARLHLPGARRGAGRRSRHAGRFGYRLELPTCVQPLIPGLNLASRGDASQDPRAAAGAAPGGPLFWTKVPNCPRSRKVAFGADYAFEGAAADKKRRRVDCRRFVRRPSVHREGQVPGAGLRRHV